MAPHPVFDCGSRTALSRGRSDRRRSRGRSPSLVPLAVFVLWIGVHPEFFLSRMRPTLEPLARQAAAAVDGKKTGEVLVQAPPGKLSGGELTRVE